jgi:hypothetical protein
MSEYSQAKVKNEKILVRWDARVLLAFGGCLFLGGGIHSILRTIHHFTDNIYSMSLIDNWLEWIVALSFFLGWLFAHGIEIAFLQKRYGVTRILILCFFIFLLITPWLGSSFSSNPLYRLLDYVFDFVTDFALAGYFFRYSMYQKEALPLIFSVLFEKRYWSTA